MGLVVESMVGETSGTSTDRGGVVYCVVDLAVSFPVGIGALLVALVVQ